MNILSSLHPPPPQTLQLFVSHQSPIFGERQRFLNNRQFLLITLLDPELLFDKLTDRLSPGCTLPDCPHTAPVPLMNCVDFRYFFLQVDSLQIFQLNSSSSNWFSPGQTMPVQPFVFSLRPKRKLLITRHIKYCFCSIVHNFGQ